MKLIKHAFVAVLASFSFISCTMSRPASTLTDQPTVSPYGTMDISEPITESLFIDKESKISEENIKKILDGEFALPNKLRVVIINLENNHDRRSRWNNEDYLNSRQKYQETITESLNNHSRIESVSLIPTILLSGSPSFTDIREAAVRMQADVVLVYSITGGTYQNYKVFKANEYKAFATTQMMLIDTRTGLIPFTEVATRDFFSKRLKDDFNEDEAEKRTQEESVMLTLNGICQSMNKYLDEK